MLLWMLFGFCLGIIVAAMRTAYIDAENRRLRSALQNVRTMALFGNNKSIVRAVDSVLEQEAA